MGRDFKKLASNRGGHQDSITPQTAKNRLIVITVAISEKITDDEDAYKALLNALVSIHTSTGLLEEHDFICYNIGSPQLEV
jgi:hypothetical protein